MTAPARLLALRLHGFKSFAERTTVEFGPGISAVVGPNGSGKSNLADALRWALGEQGRSLRMRRAEDVIWAGSERRSAQGMADVTLVLDNSDGLLPVDFSVVELGRRLYRSGENDYLLNRQRVRLKDLVDLLDTAHLADNAFLFIGQGMVDQALALRPEERRPLFEEVAGVRRHERRRKRSEEQLAESLANLARLEDILAELRPQARRLASQAELQASRQSAGHELVAALLLSAHARWHEAASRVAAAGSVRSRTRHDADLAMSELTTAEELAADITRQLAARASEERVRRRAHEAAGTVHNAIGLRHERLAAERDGLARDRARLATERDAVTGALDAQRRTLRIPEPAWDLDLESSLGEAERSLAEAQRELATLLAADRARGEQLAALGRAEAARGAELELVRRRQAEADRRAGAERALETAAAEQLPALEAALGGARAALASSIETERLAVVARELARQEGEATEAARAAAGERAQAEVGALAARRSRLDALAARLTEEEGRGIAHAARRRGGRRLDADLVVDPALRGAVQSALAEAARAYLVTRDAVMPLGAERGILMVADDSGASRPDRAREVAERRIRDLALAMGGGVLDAAIRRDSVGGATRILARAIWLPSLADCIELQRELPPGWLAVPRNGGALVTDLTVALGVTDGTLERRAEMHALGAEVARLEHEAASAQERAAAATAGAATARANLDRARATESASSATRRRAEEAERLAARRLEATAREHAWHRSQADRLTAQTALQAAVETLQAASGAAGAGGAGQNAAAEGSEAEPGGGASARSTWQRRVADVRARRDRLAEQAAIGDLALREADARRARAEATLAASAERLTVIDRELQALADGERELTQAREQLSHEAAEASVAEAAAREGLDRLLAADGTDRDRLAGAEQIVATVRERLRIIMEQSRAADHASLTADLGLEALREQLLVDLTSLGDAALRELPVVGPSPSTGAASQQSLSGGGFPVAGAEVAAAIVSELVPDDERGRMEQHLAAATARWSSEQPATEAPSAARLGSLRRRFSDLGAANPFAVEEYEALRARLADLETQRADLGRAIERTRQLIEELAGLIALQFRATFRALETAFDQRFQQLFGGGFARLELTDPDDLGATGVEITARPPGKRKQPLSMLSGGERSLTAVALLLAMLQVRPVPFCVLDEVDAALDEANVGRFTAALRDLAAATQFIIITHNRGTIRAADALYGVTVGDDSVSRVISLRLDDARALAGTRRASGADAVVASDPAVDVAAG